MHDILLIVGSGLLTFAATKLSGGPANEVVVSRIPDHLLQQVRYIYMALPDILAVVSDLETGVAGLSTEVQALIARVNAGAGSISAADADALQARLESLRAAVASIPAIPS